MSESDMRFMKEAIDWARDCIPKSGNIPKVGAIIAHGEKAIARGRRGTGKDGDDDHAELNALHQLLDKSQLPEATLYTTLEPCTREVRTKELECCSELIIQHKIKKVFVGILDPNQGVAGKGLSRLQDSDVEVELFPHELAKQIKAINTAFIRSQQTLGARIIDPKNGDVLKTYETDGRHPVRFKCLNPPTDDTYLFSFRDGLWWPQPQKFREIIGGRIWEVDAYFGATGEHALHIVTANELGKVLIRYYWKVVEMNKERKEKLSDKLSEGDREMLRYVYPGIEMTGLPKGLRSEDWVTVEIAEAGR